MKCQITTSYWSTLWVSTSASPLSSFITVCFFHPPMKLQKGNVFSHICLSTGEGPHVTHYPSCIGPYCAIPPIQGPSPSHSPPVQSIGPLVQDPGPDSLLVTSGSQDWGPFQTCSLQDLTVRPLLVLTSGSWLLKHYGG